MFRQHRHWCLPQYHRWCLRYRNMNGTGSISIGATMPCPGLPGITGINGIDARTRFRILPAPDDSVAKPREPLEIQARIKQPLRRASRWPKMQTAKEDPGPAPKRAVPNRIVELLPESGSLNAIFRPGFLC